MTAVPMGMRVVQLDIDCNGIIDWAESLNEWETSPTTDHPDGDGYRTSSSMFIPFHSYDNPSHIVDMNQKVYDAVCAYSWDFDFDFSDVEDVSLQRYTKGEEYKPHYDSDPNAPRIVSAVLYLNSVAGGGGETYFTNFDYSVKPKPGRLAIFPSDYLFMHQSMPVKKSVKYAAAFWAIP